MNYIDLDYLIRKNLNIQLITCAHCGEVVSHPIDFDVEKEITCHFCGTVITSNECPDFICEGVTQDEKELEFPHLIEEKN